MDRFQNHLGRILPRLRGKTHSLEPVTRDTSHTAMNVGKMRSVHYIQNPSGQWRAEVAMKRRHCAIFDRTLETGAHHKLRSSTEFLNKMPDIPKIVGAICITHQDVTTTDKW